MTKQQRFLTKPILCSYLLVFTLLLNGCCLHCLGLTGDMYKFSNPNRTKIYSCYADERTDPESAFYALIEAQKLYNQKEYEKALPYLETIIRNNASKAQEIQNSLREKPWESKEKVWGYKELNAVGTALVIKGLVHYKLNQFRLAEESLNKQISDYPYAQCWNPEGWFIDLEDNAKEVLKEISKKNGK